MRVVRALRRFVPGTLLVGSLGSLGSARAAPPTAYDVASLPAPVTPSDFATLESSTALGARVISAGARVSYLERPLALRLPAATSEGTTASAVDRLVQTEVLLAGGLTRSLDVGFGLPLRFFQEGYGLGAVGGREEIRALALGDPRVFVAHAIPLVEEVPMRVYGTVFVPLASKNAFAGGASARGAVGFAASYGDVSRVGVDLSGRFEEATEFGSTTMGSSVRLGVGFSQELAERFRVGLELSGALVVASQSAPPDGSPPSVFPLELLVRAGRGFAFGEFALLGGLGLPTSVSSSLTGASPILAPGTPVFRLGLEFRYRLEPWNSSRE